MGKRPDNQLSTEQLAEVLRLSLVEGLSARMIAKQLSLSRNTVRKMLGRAPARAPRPIPRRGSILEPYKPEIKDLLEEASAMRAPAVLERLRPLGYTGGISILRDYLRQTRPRPNRDAFLTLSFRPGAAMQVDWADFGYAIPGCPRRVSALVMVLCYSRYLYIEFTLSQTFGTFVRSMERGLTFFGGTTLVDIFDFVSGNKIEVLFRSSVCCRPLPVSFDFSRFGHESQPSWPHKQTDSSHAPLV